MQLGRAEWDWEEVLQSHQVKKHPYCMYKNTQIQRHRHRDIHIHRDIDIEKYTDIET